MLSPSDFNNAVPQFTNGDYASNPINPQYIAEPDAVNYNRGAEPLQTLPAQWWNWFLNKITSRFNKVNIYVKNIFNELTQLLSLVSVDPSGTEGTPTIGQLKDMFETKYPDYLKTTPALSNTYVPQTTKVNGHALSGNITITCVACAGANGSGTAFGTSATVNTGTAAGCIPTVGTALGTTDGQFLATDSTGKLKPSGYTASSFRSSSWTPSLVACACYGKNGSTYSAFGSNAFNSTAFTTCTGTVTQVKVGTTAYNPSSGVISLPAYPSAPTCVACAGANGSGTAFGTAAVCSTRVGGSVTHVPYTGADGCPLLTSNFLAYWNGAYTNTGSSNLRYYSGGAFGSAAGKTAGSAAGNVPLVGSALGTTNNNIVVTDTNGCLKPSGVVFGSAVANVPLIGTALGTTNGQFVATDASGCLKPSGYTASSFLGATSKACCSATADFADVIRRITSSVTCTITIGSVFNNKLPLDARCGNDSIALCVSNSHCSDSSGISCCAKCLYPEVANALCTPNSSSICNKCSFAVLAFNSCNGCVMYLPSKKCMNASNPSCFCTTALRII